MSANDFSTIQGHRTSFNQKLSTLAKDVWKVGEDSGIINEIRMASEFLFHRINNILRSFERDQVLSDINRNFLDSITSQAYQPKTTGAHLLGDPEKKAIAHKYLKDLAYIIGQETKREIASASLPLPVGEVIEEVAEEVEGDTVPAKFLAEAEASFNPNTLQAERSQIDKLIASGSPHELFTYIDVTLNPRLAAVKVEISKLDKPDMDEVVQKLMTVHLVDHAAFIADAIERAAQRIEEQSAKPIRTPVHMDATRADVVEEVLAAPFPTLTIGLESDDIGGIVVDNAPAQVQKPVLTTNPHHDRNAELFKQAETLNGDDLKKFHYTVLKPTLHSAVKAGELDQIEHLRGIHSISLRRINAEIVAKTSPDTLPVLRHETAVPSTSKALDVLVQSETDIERAMANKVTKDDIFALYKDTLAPARKAVFVELDARINKASLSPKFTGISDVSLLQHSEFLNSQMKICKDRLVAPEPVQKLTTEQKVAAALAAFKDWQRENPRPPKPVVVEQVNEIPTEQKSRLGAWLKDSWSKASNKVKAAVALTLGGAATLATAFAINANKAPEAPDVPKITPVAVTASTDTVAQTEVIPPAPVARTIEPVAPVAPVVVVAAPVQAKPSKLSIRSFAPVVKVKDDKPIIEESFDISASPTSLETWQRACNFLKENGKTVENGICPK